MRWVLALVLMVASLGEEASACPIQPHGNCRTEQIARQLGHPRLAVRDELLPLPWVHSFVQARDGDISVVSRNFQLIIRRDDGHGRDYQLVDLDDGRAISLTADSFNCSRSGIFVPDWPPTPGHDYALRTDTGEDLAILRVEYRVEILDAEERCDRTFWGTVGVALLGGAFLLTRRRRLAMAV